MYDTILVPTDDSNDAVAAGAHAISLANAHGGTVHVLSVIETRTGYDSSIIDPVEAEQGLRKLAEEAVARLADRAEAAGVSVTTAVETGVPPTVITSYAATHDVDLICLGERGQSDLAAVLLGSTAEAVLRESNTPVLVVSADDVASSVDGVPSSVDGDENLADAVAPSGDDAEES